MKDLFNDAFAGKLQSMLETTGGVKALYGDPVILNGEQIIPVARISITLGAAAEGSGRGDAGTSARLSSLAKGGGGGNADASVKIDIEPVGFVRNAEEGPAFTPLK